jgi:CBS domain containing-hemolysin-like protein
VNPVLFLIALAVLGPLLVLFTSIQMLFLEGLRLRGRELPSVQHFKAVMEPRLDLRTDEGMLVFSLWKHILLALFGVFALASTLGGTPLEPAKLFEGLGIAFGGVVVLSCLIPQLLLRRSGGRWLGPFIPLLALGAAAMRPLVSILNFVQSLLDVVKQDAPEEEPATAAENIDALIAAGAEEGLFEEDDRRLIQSVMEFDAKTVREVMTARPNIISIAAESTLEALHSLVVNEQYSRIPVFEGSIDGIIGFVHVRDMFEVPESSRAIRKVRELMREIQFVPETKPVGDLMREMQQQGAHLVVVVDEYGNTAGLASMEDLVEVIVGEIRDEHEPGSDVASDGNGGHIVSGNFELARLEELVEFEPEEEIESTTVGGLVMEWLGRVPKPGETVENGGIHIEVLASDNMRVEKVRLCKTKPPIIEVEEEQPQPAEAATEKTI